MKELKSVPEMADALTEHKNQSGYTQKIYKMLSDRHKGEELSADLENRIEALKVTDQRGPINWYDEEQVKQRVYDYLTACATSQTYPSVMGLSVHGLGISRQALNKFLLKHPDSPAARFVLMVKDEIADLLTNAALYRNADPVSVIFQLKNHFEHADKLQVEPVAQVDPMGDTLTADQLAAKYQDIIED